MTFTRAFSDILIPFSLWEKLAHIQRALTKLLIKRVAQIKPRLKLCIKWGKTKIKLVNIWSKFSKYPLAWLDQPE